MTKKGAGDLFQEDTKYFRGKLRGGSLLWSAKPETFKRYLSAPKIKLEHFAAKDPLSLWQAIAGRRSVRSFQNRPLMKEDLSRLLWAIQGVTHKEMGFEFRAAPSAGALYPVETYLVIHNVEVIEPGIYHYGVEKHELDQLKLGDFRLQIARAALDQDLAYAAGVVFIWTAVFKRSKWKYSQRAYRYIYLDAGHIAQNLALAAVALRLGSCPVAAFYDEEVNALLEIDGEEESAIYLAAVGHPL